MDKKLKMKKTYFDESYPLHEKVGNKNFLIKLQSGNTKLRYSPEQFGRGLDKRIKGLLMDTEREVLNSLQMEELQAMSRKDRRAHAEWVLKEVDNYVRNRLDIMIEELEQFYDYWHSLKVVLY